MLVAPVADPHASSLVGWPQAPSIAIATSVPDVAQTSRSTFGPGGTVIAAPMLLAPCGIATVHEVVNALPDASVESMYVPAPPIWIALAHALPGAMAHGCSSTTPLQLSSTPFAQTS